MQHLLILHGALGAAEQFIPLSGILNDTFIPHTLNFKGHGGETDVNEFSIELFAEQVFQYVQQHVPGKVNIFGYSMGGYVALYFAKKYPERVNKLVTLATKFLWTPAIAQQEIKMLNPEKIAEKLPAFAQLLEKRHAPHDWKKLLVKTAAMMTRLGNYSPLKDEDLEQLQVPVLVGIGDKDTMVTLEETIHVYRKLPNANLIVFPGTQHPIEKIGSKKLALEINLFLQKNSSTVVFGN